MRNWCRLIGILLLSLVWSCSSSHAARQEELQKWIQNNGKVKVLNTTAMINDIVKQIGGDHIDTLTLIQDGLDPHSYQLVKGDGEKLAFADLIFYNGLGLEHGPSLYYHLTNNPKAISLGDKVEQHYPNQHLVIQVNGQKDPHIWMDVSLWSKTIPFIVEALSQKDPAHAQDFKGNAAKLQAEMAQAHQEIKDFMHQIPENRRYLVTSHDAFNYFTRAYLSEEDEVATGGWEKRFAAPEGLAPESQLSTTDIKAIIDHMKKYQVQLLFPESNVSRDSIKKILQAGREQGLELEIVSCCPLYGDAMGESGSEGDTYIKMLRYNAKTIANHMNPSSNK